ncbi:hypothetical protein I552_7982 [Mycobacterium xenopi 3993]|nr:hypothetical protein I552_7982 [Mycobacterium xenopi 3993]
MAGAGPETGALGGSERAPGGAFGGNGTGVPGTSGGTSPVVRRSGYQVLVVARSGWVATP